MSTMIEFIKSRCHEVGECWEWAGATQTRSRVPIMRHLGNSMPVRRVLALALGHDLAGKVATYRCGNQLCCNPSHVVVMSKTALQRRTNAKCVRYLHPTRRARVASARRSRAKLTPEQAQMIRDDPRAQRVIAAEYGITQTTVSRIKRGEMWRDYMTPFSQLLGLAA